MLTKIIALELTKMIETRLQEILVSIKEQPETILYGFGVNQKDGSLWRSQNRNKSNNDVLRYSSNCLVGFHKEVIDIEKTIRANNLSVDIGNELNRAKIELSQMLKQLKQEHKTSADFWGFFDLNVTPRKYVYNI